MIAENLIGFETIPQNLPSYCIESFRRHANNAALNFRAREGWVGISGANVIEKIQKLAMGLKRLGVKPGEKVALISENRPEWSIADLAVLSLRGVTVPIYTTQAVDQIRYILEDSESKMILVSGKALFKHAEQAIQSVERLEKVVFFDEEGMPDGDNRMMSLEAVEKLGETAILEDPEMFERQLAEINPDDLATIIYTSGTTGEPKGAMLTHENFVSNVSSISKGLPIKPSDRSLSVLPLSHIFERTVFYVLSSNGVAVHYCARFDQLASHLQKVKPTIMTAVPRLFEQVYHKIVKKGKAAGGAKTKLFMWALEIGQQYWDFVEKRERVPAMLAAKHKIADKLVFTKWRDGVGGALRFFVSGGAPLSKSLAYAFWSAGIPILQGYGMTEACIVCANRPENNKVASIGVPFDGIEMRVAEKDGEVLIRGKNVMRAYFGKEEETRKAIDEEGWYHTGDVGYVDRDGHFYITDRIKDLFKLSNGKYIAPLQVESLLKQSPLIAQPVVVGNGRKQVGALIVPDWDALKDAINEAGLKAEGSREELCENPHVVKLVQDDAIRFTRELSDYERIKRVYLLPREFSIDKGEMTPTLKIKRGVIDEKYGEAIDEICGR
ncbi:MAG: long-chain fatty acid--CoA ligase [Pyrinomonadaceae bacterium]